MTDLTAQFAAARLRSEFATHDDSLLDLSNQELHEILVDLADRTALLIAGQYRHMSDSHVDDCNITISMITTLHYILYGDDQTISSTYEGFFNQLDGFIEDLTYLHISYNGANNSETAYANFNKATVFRHITIDPDYWENH